MSTHEDDSVSVFPTVRPLCASWVGRSMYFLINDSVDEQSAQCTHRHRSAWHPSWPGRVVRRAVWSRVMCPRAACCCFAFQSCCADVAHQTRGSCWEGPALPILTRRPAWSPSKGVAWRWEWRGLGCRVECRAGGPDVQDFMHRSGGRASHFSEGMDESRSES